MAVDEQTRRRAPRRPGGGGRDRLALAAPTLVAALLAGAYVLISPPSLDLTAHLFRAALFAREGFGVWDNLWYSGHEIVGYSVLFGAVSAVLTPQLAGALAATGTAALLTALVRRRFGDGAWLGAILFGAATAIDLYTGRLALAFGALPAVGAVLALDCDHTPAACGLALLAALCSPVAALFTAVIAGGYALAALARDRRIGPAIPGALVALAAIVPVAATALAFGEGGTEPFGIATLAPILVGAALALALVPRSRVTLRTTVGVYALAAIGFYLVPSPVGSNVARLGTFAAAPLAAALWWRRRSAVGALALGALGYLGWAAPVRDVYDSATDASASIAYYRPLLRFLDSRSTSPNPPFRIEIPFTRSHWEAYAVATHFPLARGWERQLDVADNPLFYSRERLTASRYEAWLHASAIRFVAAPDAKLDYSARAEMGLIDHGLPYLRLVMRSAHWRVYAVAGATPIATGAAAMTALGPDWIRLRALRAGTAIVRVHFTPYWALARGSGCVGPGGPGGRDTRLLLRAAGPVEVVTRFSIGRIGATSPRCTGAGGRGL